MTEITTWAIKRVFWLVTVRLNVEVCFHKEGPLRLFLKLINNSSNQNKGNHYREGGLEM